MATVTFDTGLFKARYPEFTAVADVLLGSYFGEAGLYLANDDSSPVSNVTTRLSLLNMLTAHIAYLAGAITGQVMPVGRVASASEGSVSTSLDYQVAGSAVWFAQTQYGAAFWQATNFMRSFRYVSCPTRY